MSILASALVAVLLLAGPLTADPIAITCGPYLQSPTATSMTVMWLTNKDSVSWVEYGAGRLLDNKAISSHDGLIDAGIRIHKIKLSGLDPGAEYSYRVHSRDILDFGAYEVKYGETVTSEVHRFRTLDPYKEKFTFLAFTDIHENNEMVAQLMKLNGDRPYDLVFFLGDIISHIEGEKQITDFINSTVEQFSSEVPFVWVRGNHETRGSFARMLP
ncbi:MAG: metallophosphoesterase, partial [bacterium]|nr:metallophosphoesterase [bacterium]